eukprot:TRINITY_DN4737_c0_g1_i1.p1 TRINITY_DN4737_c0_g1~~TRINITY_DN4737_c0_g1_i1.p1  ORF type:complete len:716 (-),score=128.64 TRINITY_DN4737_c0_g1_i1:25-2172(-)
MLDVNKWMIKNGGAVMELSGSPADFNKVYGRMQREGYITQTDMNEYYFDDTTDDISSSEDIRDSIQNVELDENTVDERTSLFKDFKESSLRQRDDIRGEGRSKSMANHPVKKDKSKKKNFVKKWMNRMPYYIPVFSWLPMYNCSYIIPDIVAAIGTASMLIPQSLAYAMLAGVSPLIGLYTAWLPTLIYSLLGTCNQLSIGPDALASLLVGVQLKQSNLLHDYAATHLLSFLVGFILFALGILRWGFLDNVLGHPLLHGFINAVGVIIIVAQIPNLLGFPDVEAELLYDEIVEIFEHTVDDIHWLTFSLGILTISILFAFKMAKTKIETKVNILQYVPETLVVVIMGIFLVTFLKLEQSGVTIVGKINPDNGTDIFFPVPQLIDFSNFGTIFPSAVMVAVIGFVESIIVAKLYASKYDYAMSPNRELVALGLANIIGAFFRTYPTFGSLPRSAVSDSLGAKSQVFGFLTSCIVLFSILVLVPLFENLPVVVMSGIIFVAACSLFEVNEIFVLIKMRCWMDAFLSVSIFFITLAVGIDIGILTCIAVSIFLVIKHTSVPHITILGKCEDNSYRDISVYSDAKTLPGILIISLEEALYFANIEQIKKIFKRIEKLGGANVHPAEADSPENIPTFKAIIIHASHVPSMDGTAVHALCEMINEYEKKNITICMVELKSNLQKIFDLAGYDESKFIFQSIDSALGYIDMIQPEAADYFTI